MKIYKKRCSLCCGSGYESIDLDGSPIDLICDMCNGSGEEDLDLVILSVSIYKNPLVKEILVIEDNVSRPNNPDIHDIVDTWVFYNFGKVNYDYEEITSNSLNFIDDSWNIENYR